jgi:hypothetical protein
VAPKSNKTTKKMKDLPGKKLNAKKAGNVKGGGPGTQTEDDLYVGVRRR